MAMQQTILSTSMRWFLLCGLFGALASASSSLRQVVVISRHGVRGPYGLGTDIPEESILKQYIQNPNIDLPMKANDWGTSETDDPEEIVSPKITKHGYRLVQTMGKYFREHLYRDFLTGKCGESFAYADENQRDNLTAQAFFSGMLPTCPDIYPITAETRLLFEQGQDPTATCPVCSRTVYEGITGANDTRYLVEEQQELIQEINDILQCCATNVCDGAPASPFGSLLPTTCSLFQIPTQWNGAFYAPWRDTLFDADYFSEWFMLQSLNNMTLPASLTFKKVLSLAKIHETHMDLVTNAVNSANFGATLLAHVTASFQQTVLGKPVPLAEGEGPRLVQNVSNRFLYYAGHDINLLYLRNLLRLQWYSKGWHPHQPTPGGMIIFELHSTDKDDLDVVPKRSFFKSVDSAHNDDANDKAYFIKAYFVTASPEQMRYGEELTAENPPDRVPIVIPMCSHDHEREDGSIELRCPFSQFKRVVGRTLKHECVADTLRPFVEALDRQLNNYAQPMAPVVGKSPPSTSTSSTSSISSMFSTLLWLLFAALCCGFVGFVSRHYWRRRQASTNGDESPIKPHKATNAYGTLQTTS